MYRTIRKLSFLLFAFFGFAAGARADVVYKFTSSIFWCEYRNGVLSSQMTVWGPTVLDVTSFCGISGRTFTPPPGYDFERTEIVKKSKGVNASGYVIETSSTLMGTYTSTPYDIYAYKNANTYENSYFTGKEIAVSYNGNGATGGSTASSTFTYDVAQSIAENGFAREFTVSYNANGGSVNPSSATATSTFLNWANTASGSASYTYTSGQTGVTNPCDSTGGDVTLFARWQDASVTLPTPTRSDHTFNGWYTAQTGGTRVGGAGDAYTPAASTALYAQWTEVPSYTITIKPGYEGGSIQTKTYKVSSAEQTISFTKLSRTEYTRTSWLKDFSKTTGTEPEVYESSILIPAGTYGDFTITAQWTGKDYTITVSASGGTGESSVQYATSPSEQKVAFTDPSRGGYEISGWSVGSGWTGSAPTVANQQVTIPANTYGSFTITPTWTGKTYSTTIAPGEGGEGGDSRQYTVGGLSQQWSFTAPMRTGYHVGSWTYEGWTGSQPSVSGSTLTIPANTYGNITATPTWSANSATITYENYHQFGAFHPDSMTYDAIVKVSKPTDGGNAFGGWQVTEGLNAETAQYSVDGGSTWQTLSSDEMKVGAVCETVYFKNLTAEANGAVTLYANWNTSYTITTTAEPASGGTVAGGGTYASGESVTLTATPNEGYSFEKWKDDATPSASRQITVTQDAAYTACFTGNMYRVQFDAVEGGISGVGKFYVQFGTPYGTYRSLPTPTPPEDQEFAGWYTEEEGGALVTDDTIVSTVGTHTLYAQYANIPHNFHYVRFDRNGATNETEMALQTFDGAQTNALSANVYGKVGYTFDGWATNLVGAASCRTVYTNCQEVAFPLAKAGETNVLYAVWATNRYTIAFDPGNAPADTNHYFFGTMAPLTNCAYDTAITITCGYTNYCSQGLLGWSRTKGATVAEYKVKFTSPLTLGNDVVVSNLTAEANATQTLYAVWADVGGLSETVGLTNAVLYSTPYQVGQEVKIDCMSMTRTSDVPEWDRGHDERVAWVIASGTSSETVQSPEYCALNALFKGAGTLRFSWCFRSSASTTPTFTIYDGSDLVTNLVETSAQKKPNWDNPVVLRLSGEGEHQIGWRFCGTLNSKDLIAVDNISWTPEETSGPEIRPGGEMPTYGTEAEAAAAAKSATVVRPNADVEGVVSAEDYKAMFDVVVRKRSSAEWALEPVLKPAVSNDVQAAVDAAASNLVSQFASAGGVVSVGVSTTAGLYYGLSATNEVEWLSLTAPTNWVLGAGAEQEIRADRPSAEAGFFKVRAEVLPSVDP